MKLGLLLSLPELVIAGYDPQSMLPCKRGTPKSWIPGRARDDGCGVRPVERLEAGHQQPDYTNRLSTHPAAAMWASVMNTDALCSTLKRFFAPVSVALLMAGINN